jgi:hypothetical protein
MSMVYVFTKANIIASAAAKQKISRTHYVKSSAWRVDMSYPLEWLIAIMFHCMCFFSFTSNIFQTNWLMCIYEYQNCLLLSILYFAHDK